jgi:hypothetical protein
MVCRSVAQPGSASDWGSEGRGFESRHSDHVQGGSPIRGGQFGPTGVAGV